MEEPINTKKIKNKLLEAKRVLIFSSGLVQLLTGALVFCWSCIFLMKIDLPKYVFPINFFLFFIAIWPIILHLRRKRGIVTLVPKWEPTLEAWKNKKFYILTLLTGVIVLLFIGTYKNPGEISLKNTIYVVTVFLFFAEIYYLWRFSKLHLWEDFAACLGLVLVSILLHLSISRTYIWMTIGLVFMTIGVSLHIRWHRWIKNTKDLINPSEKEEND